MAHNQDAPKWLQDDDPQEFNGPNMTNKNIGSVEGTPVPMSEEELQKAKMLYYGIKGLTLGLCVLMFATAVIRLETIDEVGQSNQIFVAVYMMFFSTLLFTFEAVQTRPIEWVEHMLKRNFGFLFNAVWKALFIVFIAFLCLGLDGTLAFFTGVLVAGFGAAQIALYLKDPRWFEYKPPPLEM